MKICPGSISGNETAMTIKHQSPFKEGEVLQIQKRLLDSARIRHAENMVKREAYRALFGDEWFEGEAVDTDLSDDKLSADLNALLDECPMERSAIKPDEPGKCPAIEPGLFAGAPSYRVATSATPRQESGQAIHSLDEQRIPRPAILAKLRVNAKSGRSNRLGQALSTPGRAGLIASFSLSHAAHVVAINKLHPDVDHDQLEALLRIDAFIQKLVRDYQGAGELPEWEKFVSPEIKQFFRIFHLCGKPDSKTLTIRLDHKMAEAALVAPRGPANYLAAIIKRTLAKLGIETDLTFNLEFNHTGRAENHPAHIHGTLCIPNDRVDEVTEALRNALAEGYRQRYKNLAVHIEKPRSARAWAAYCIKEYDNTASKLTNDRGRKNRPEYSNRKLTQDAKAFYKNISAWLGE
ncbi:hypothetical protein ALP77_00289 [Pseudomonas amygdali pv. tabaci]|nr:Uncharacterized protein ALO35_03116 [Pseudomonas amygdali pv. lachrymans]KPY79960.1 Uncharacterized protein ALO60_03177 [Pseudomonas amygdali pv. tabaci]RMR81256.1 hypothetical protein ALP77_00289 [Pseudomonas amygdali pv. tabaci]BCS42749.1 hypothetical protein Pta6605_10800 [Pseudomonas amygdali pv. tabaci]